MAHLSWALASVMLIVGATSGFCDGFGDLFGPGQIARATGGTYIKTDKAHFQEGLDASTQQMLHNNFVDSIDFTLTGNSEKSLEFPVDETISSLFIIAFSPSPKQSTNVLLFPPGASTPLVSGGDSLEYKMENSDALKVQSPKSGLWKAVIRGQGNISVRIQIKSTLVPTVVWERMQWMQERGGNFTCFSFGDSKPPALGNEYFANVYLKTPVASIQVSSRDKGGGPQRPLESMALQKRPGQVFRTEMVPPSNSFDLFIEGITQGGNPFRRLVHQGATMIPSRITGECLLGRPKIFCPCSKRGVYDNSGNFISDIPEM
jgi:hypothetical protein